MAAAAQHHRGVTARAPHHRARCCRPRSLLLGACDAGMHSPSRRAAFGARRRLSRRGESAVLAAAPPGDAASAAAAEAPPAASAAAPPPPQLRVEVVRAISEVPAAEWDALVVGDDSNSSGNNHEVNPFLKHAFLLALEESGSAVPEAGWGAQHVTVRDAASGALLGAAPLYLKGHSYGEYVFDQSWAQFSELQLGKRYYPKLLCGVPFTPVTGPRLLATPGAPPPLRAAVVRALASSLVSVADALGVSGLHINFCTGDEWAALGALGLQQRKGIQFMWENRGYATFADFEADLKQSKRKAVRQERKSVAKQGLTLRRLSGRDVTPAMWDTFYSFYLNTVDKRWGSAYLTRDFFARLGATMPDDVLLVAAFDDATGELVAGALNLIGSHCLYGRNWGHAPGRDFKHLHFALCYYEAIEEAIERGLPRVEAGAQGEHKLQRGYLPQFTYSAHYLADPSLRAAVGRFLEREAEQRLQEWQQLTVQASPFKDEHTAQFLGEKASLYASLESASEEGGLSD